MIQNVKSCHRFCQRGWRARWSSWAGLRCIRAWQLCQMCRRVIVRCTWCCNHHCCVDRLCRIRLFELVARLGKVVLLVPCRLIEKEAFRRAMIVIHYPALRQGDSRGSHSCDAPPRGDRGTVEILEKSQRWRNLRFLARCGSRAPPQLSALDQVVLDASESSPNRPNLLHRDAPWRTGHHKEPPSKKSRRFWSTSETWAGYH